MTLLDKPYGTGDEFQRFVKVGVIDNGEEIRSILIPLVAIDDTEGSWAEAIVELLTSLDITADEINIKLPALAGTYMLRMGASGQVTIPDGGRVLGAACIATGAGATVRVRDANNDETAPVPQDIGWELAPHGNLLASPVIFDFSSTASFTVEWLE